MAFGDAAAVAVDDKETMVVGPCYPFVVGVAGAGHEGLKAAWEMVWLGRRVSAVEASEDFADCSLGGTRQAMGLLGDVGLEEAYWVLRQDVTACPHLH